MQRLAALALASTVGLLAACHTSASAPSPATDSATDSERTPAAAPKDPRNDEIVLTALAGWNGTLVIDQAPVGIWTVMPFRVFPQFGCPEIVAIDDLGRLHALWSYSGKWTPVSTVHDGKWLGGLAQCDVDPRVPGVELYTGSQNGNLYQVTSHLETFLDSKLIAQFPGHEIHTVAAADFDTQHPGNELIVFTRPGRMFVMQPRADGLVGFEPYIDTPIESRIRDAILLPTEPGSPALLATIGRHGELETLHFADGAPVWTTVHRLPMGRGRVAMRPGSTARDLVLYTVADDGQVWRHASTGGAWNNELIYAGPQGMRGCAAGRFDADPNVETVAVFGYSGRVELLSLRDGRWSAETLFVDRDKGHWLCAGEFDGRNTTDELVASGYSGRVVLLSRPPGHGREGLLTLDTR